jgi:hypothetical protein
MKIIMFQYNRGASAIIQESTLANENIAQKNVPLLNRFLANGYEDRLLWEEAASLRPPKKQEYVIVGNWQ